jgi:outer membrane protein W
MMKRIVIILCLISCGSFLSAQYAPGKFAVSVNANYTTSSKLYLFPNAIDPFLRNQNIPLEDIYSYSAEVRYAFNESIAIGLGTELLERTEFGKNITVAGPSGITRLEIEDGYKMYPIELTLYYIMPFSTESFKFFMGGGGAVYIGEHIRKFGNASVSNQSREFSYGIHVSAGMEYMITEYFSVRGETQFRDPEFEMTSKYDNTEVLYNGSTYTIPDDTFESEINIDGVTFTLGAVFHF